MIIHKHDIEAYWCPFARTVVGDVSFNRCFDKEQEGDLVACRGDACMAWRWVPASERDGDPSYGYCGLAGRPE